jgi:hypothetical protein
MQKNDFSIKRIDSMKAWEEISISWNELLAQSSQNSVFLTWEWLYTWAECYLNKSRLLFIIAIYDQDELIGVAPWFLNCIDYKITSLKQIESIGSPEAGSDYLDVIGKKGKEKEVAFRIYDYLIHEVPLLWDRMVLRDMPSNSLFLLHFMDRIEEDGKYAEIRKGAYCPIVILPRKGEDLLSLYSSNRRQQHRRHFRILNKAGILKHETFNEGDLHKALHQLLDFYEAKNEKANKTLKPFLGKYVSRCSENKVVQVDMLLSDGKLIASFFHLKYNDNLYMYLMAVDKECYPHISLGNIFVGLCMSNAIESGFIVYDFLKGTEAYKFHWATEGRASVTFSFSQKKFLPICLAMGTFIKYPEKLILR